MPSRGDEGAEEVDARPRDPVRGARVADDTDVEAGVVGHDDVVADELDDVVERSAHDGWSRTVSALMPCSWVLNASKWAAAAGGCMSRWAWPTGWPSRNLTRPTEQGDPR